MADLKDLLKHWWTLLAAVMADPDLKDLYSFKHWWTLLAVTGGLIAVAATPKAWVPGWLVGLGLLLFGAGQWISRPSKKKRETVEGLKGFHVVTAYEWHFDWWGTSLVVVGVLLFLLGVWFGLRHTTNGFGVSGSIALRHISTSPGRGSADELCRS
jgi:hypothetical protein